MCDGRQVNRTTFAVLFSVISTTFGVGNGSTTFNLPDFRGKMPVGANNASEMPAGLDATYTQRFIAEGQTGGSQTGEESITVTEFLEHYHSIGETAHFHGITSPVDPAHSHSFFPVVGPTGVTAAPVSGLLQVTDATAVSATAQNTSSDSTNVSHPTDTLAFNISGNTGPGGTGLAVEPTGATSLVFNNMTPFLTMNFIIRH
jgi:microcystin-dependent protein